MMRSWLRRTVLTLGLLACFSATGCTGDAGKQFRDAIVSGVAGFLGATTTEILEQLFPGPEGT